MNITPQILKAIGASDSDAEKYAPAMNERTNATGIDTPLRTAHFLAQVFHESGKLSVVHENLNYAAERLLAVFPSRFTQASAQAIAGQPGMALT